MVTPLLSLFSFIFGLLLGSFLNVCIYRLPRGQSVVVPRSHCPNCGRFLRWHQNLPVFSYLELRGRCHFCKKKISFQYPLVELITGLFSLFIYLKFGGGLPYLFYFVLLAAPLITITFIDLDHRIIPDVLSLPGIFSGILAVLFLSGLPPTQAILQSLLGILAGGGTLFLVSWLYEKLRHQEGIGGGDIKLAAMLGAYFGWKGVLVILLFSFFLGSLVGLFFIIVLRKGLKFALPYGPFLAVSSLLYLFYGRQMVTWYLSMTYKLYVMG